MSTHTPGPWRATVDPHGKPHYWVKTTGGFVVARVSGHGERDARLIAAAPELKNLLFHALHYIETPGDFTETERLELCQDIDDLIAKAEGRA